MGFRRTQAPGDLDADGVRKYTEEQLLKIQRSTAETDSTIKSLQDVDASIIARLVALEHAAFGQGKFQYVDATTCKLVPYNGNKIKINGQVYDIPAAGVTFTNSGLSANTLYFAYLAVSGGSLVASWGTGGPVSSSTAGNEGVMVHNASDTLSLVGMVYTNAAAQFQDSIKYRGVRTWFNDIGIHMYSTDETNVSCTVTGSWTELLASMRCFGLLWTGETYDQISHSQVDASSAGDPVYLINMLNGGLRGEYAVAIEPISFYSLHLSITVTEAVAGNGLYNFSLAGLQNAGAGHVTRYNVKCTRVKTFGHP